MILSKETLLMEANRTGFRAEILEKVIHLMGLLNAFSSDAFLQSRLVLKGGTALNLFYFDLPRLSVDIDLNYVGGIDRETMLIEKPQVILAIEKIFQDNKYITLRQPSEHAGGKWVLSYKSELTQRGQLEIDLNFILRVSLWKISRLDSIKIGAYQAKSIAVLEYHDLIGGKLAALFARHKSRDLFDTYNIFARGKKPDKDKLKLAFLVYGACSRMDLRKISLNHLHFDANELKNSLLPVLRNEDLKGTQSLKAWAKNLIDVCKAELSEVIRFNANEHAFLTALTCEGEIKAELITEEPELIRLIKTHPVLLWKALNVKEHNRNKQSDDALN